jgi:predicted enzyme related to lactoylglutathione lyase
VFGWTVRDDREEPAFDDGSGHVIGQFMPDLAVAGDAGFRPYIYVNDLDATVAAITERGGQIVTPPYPEGDLWVALFRDPAGNIVGAWQHGSRA